MADTQIQLPTGYEDATPVKTQQIQLPSGYEDATPVGKSVPKPALTVQEGYKTGTGKESAASPIAPPPLAGMPKSSYEVRPVLPSGERAGSMQSTEADKNKPYETLPEKGARLGREVGSRMTTGLYNFPRYAGPEYGAPLTQEQMHQQHPIAMGIGQGVGSTVGGFVADPVNVAMMASGVEVPGVLGKLVAGGFGYELEKGTLQNAMYLKDHWGEMSPEQRAEYITNTGLSGILATAALSHATTGEGGVHEEVVRPAIRAVSTGLQKAAPAIPHALGFGIGTLAAEEAGIPHPWLVGAAGGAVARKIVPPEAISEFFEKGKTYGMSPEEKAVTRTQERLQDATKKLDTAQKEYDNHLAGQRQGLPMPKDVENAYNKARDNYDLAKAHADAARLEMEQGKQPDRPVVAAPPKTEAPIEAPKPVEVPAQRPVVGREPINVKRPGQIQPETFPQRPTNAPTVSEGATVPLAGEQGVRVGRPRLLTEGKPEIPTQEILPPERPKIGKEPKPERGNVRALTVDEHGNVIDKEQATPEGRMQTLLEESLKPSKISGFPEAKVEKVEKPVEAPKAEEKPAEAPKVEEKKTEEKPIRSEAAQEAEGPVREQVGNLRDAKLKELAKAHGIDPEQYDFKLRDENRHRTDRNRLVNDVVAKMGDDEVQNIAKSIERRGPEASQKSIADQAETHFPRLRGPVDEFGNPKVSGGSPEKEEGEKFYHGANAEGTKAIEESGKIAPKSLTQAHLTPDRSTAEAYAKANGGKVFTVNAKDVPENVLQHYRETGRGPIVLSSEHEVPIEKRAGEERRAAAQEVSVERRFGQRRAKPEMAPNLEALWQESVFGKKPAGDIGAKVREAHPEPTRKEVATAAQVKAHEANGGSTFDAKGKDLSNEDAYAVGAYPERSLTVDKLTNDVLDKYKKDNADVLGKEGHAIGTWKDPDTGKTVLDVTNLIKDRDEAIAAGKDANQKSIYHLKNQELVNTGGTGTPKPSAENAKLSEEELLKKGYTKEDIEEGRHLPSVSGASGKEMPSGDDLIKKYGESSGDPAQTTFILEDGRGVANTGTDHDRMLGGKATDKNPRREQFVAEGNIRVRPRMGAGREVSFSLPEKGINTKQLDYLVKMAPQLKSGAVMMEIGKPGGDYRILSHGEATPESLRKTIGDLVTVKNEKGSPIDEFGNPLVSGGAPSADAEKASKLPKLAEKNLRPEERAGVTKSEEGTKAFVKNLLDLPDVKEQVDIAKGGEGGKDWYSRSSKGFDAMHEEAPKYFKPEDKSRFINFLASLSPQQSVAMNLREALHTWKEYKDAGEPTGKELEKLLKDNVTLPGAKIPNATKALAGEPLWPDLSKNTNFKVPSFGDNLNGDLDRATNDGWMGLFNGLDARQLSRPTVYHAVSAVTRAAAKELGWETAEAQAAIWAFTKVFTEKGETDPVIVRKYSEDFADIMAHDPETRQLLQKLGVNLDKLDSKLKAIGQKPKVSPGTHTPSASNIGKLTKRVEAARGKGAIPAPKSGYLFYEEEPDEGPEFNPEKLKESTKPRKLKKR